MFDCVEHWQRDTEIPGKVHFSSASAPFRPALFWDWTSRPARLTAHPMLS
jgi:hypothetical protein